jgi:hypothetical protein
MAQLNQPVAAPAMAAPPPAPPPQQPSGGRSQLRRHDAAPDPPRASRRHLELWAAQLMANWDDTELPAPWDWKKFLPPEIRLGDGAAPGDGHEQGLAGAGRFRRLPRAERRAGQCPGPAGPRSGRCGRAIPPPSGSRGRPPRRRHRWRPSHHRLIRSRSSHRPVPAPTRPCSACRRAPARPCPTAARGSAALAPSSRRATPRRRTRTASGRRCSRCPGQELHRRARCAGLGAGKAPQGSPPKIPKNQLSGMVALRQYPTVTSEAKGILAGASGPASLDMLKPLPGAAKNAPLQKRYDILNKRQAGLAQLLQELG